MDLWKDALWRQFGAAIDTLDDALRVCPDSLWRGGLWSKQSEFWYVAYHTLFWLDLYLFGSEEGFTPPEPFTLSELEEGVLPERPYTKDELRSYLVRTRQTCQTMLEAMTEETARRPVTFPWARGAAISMFELHLYNMRHVQEHAAQLNLFLGQHGQDGDSDWNARARDVQSAG
jgi:hypothetical protein